VPLAPLSEAESAPSLSAARAASALAAAGATHSAALIAYDTARLDLAAALADHDALTKRADELRVLADDAIRRAAASSRTLAALVRGMAQHGSETAAIDAVLGARGQDDLLARMGIVDRLSTLAGSLSDIRERVELDDRRSTALEAEHAEAVAAVAAVPLAAKQAAFAAAEITLSQATDALTAAARAAESALAESTVAPAAKPARAASQLAGILGARLSGQGWATPAVARVSDGFGPRPLLPLPGVQPFHSGTDLAAVCGSPVYAAAAGVVVQAGEMGTYGNWILIDHGDGVSTGYAHIGTGSTLVAVGDAVTAGQLIAGVGSTGASTGCHLHLEVRIDGTAVDAQPFFAARGIDLGAE
jgi:murein DD-endopeptidase MepM/ murein hydrolase activator NlpD